MPYRGGGPALLELIAGQVQANFANMLSGLPHARSGKLRGLAITSARRSPAAPDLPTVAEAGVPGYEAVQWNGILAPMGTPRPIIVKLNREIGGILARPDLRERVTADGSQPVGGTPEQFGAFIKADLAKWAKVIKAENIRTPWNVENP